MRITLFCIISVLFCMQGLLAQVTYKETNNDSLQEIKKDQIDSIKQLRNDLIDSSIDKLDKISHVEFAVDYMSKVVYLGRNYGIKGYAVNLTAGYYHKIGFYGEVIGYHLSDVPSSKQNDPVSQYLAQVDLALGFRREILENWNIDLSYSYWIILYGNSNFRNALKNSFDLNTSYELSGFQAAVDLFYMWGKNSDFEMTFGIGKGFNLYHLFGKDRLIITPTFNVGLGSTSGLVKKNQLLTETNPQKSANLDKFRLLDLEPSIPVEYHIGPMDITVSASLELPQNIKNPAESTLGSKPFMLYQATLKFYIH